MGTNFSKESVIKKLIILGIEFNDFGWAIITRKDCYYGFVDTTTGTIIEPKYGGYSLNKWFFYGILPNYHHLRLYDKGQFYVRGIKERLFKRTEYLDVQFGTGDFRIASIGNTKYGGKHYLVNYRGKKLFLGDSEAQHGSKRVSITTDGLYVVENNTYNCELERID